MARRPCVEATAHIVVLEQLGSVDACQPQVVPESVGEPITVFYVDEDAGVPRRVFCAVLSPPTQSVCDARIERPRMRVIRLVSIESDGTTLEIEVTPHKAKSFLLPHALTGEKAVRVDLAPS